MPPSHQNPLPCMRLHIQLHKPWLPFTKQTKASLLKKTKLSLSLNIGGAATQGLMTCLSCEIEILQAKNVEFKSHGSLFVRYYLSTGNNKRAQLNSREISAKADLFWNESFSLQCSGTEDSINNLKQQTVVFELRWRSTNPILGKIRGSQLLGRAEVPWKTVLESPKLEIEKWVTMVPNKGIVPDDVKPPSVHIAMRVRVPAMAEMEKTKRRSGRLKRWDDCGCCKDSGCRCEEYDIFVLVAALEAL